jgi:hypothetical protein
MSEDFGLCVMFTWGPTFQMLPEDVGIVCRAAARAAVEGRSNTCRLMMKYERACITARPLVSWADHVKTLVWAMEFHQDGDYSDVVY